MLEEDVKKFIAWRLENPDAETVPNPLPDVRGELARLDWVMRIDETTPLKLPDGTFPTLKIDTAVGAPTDAKDVNIAIEAVNVVRIEDSVGRQGNWTCDLTVYLYFAQKVGGDQGILRNEIMRHIATLADMGGVRAIGAVAVVPAIPPPEFSGYSEGRNQKTGLLLFTVETTTDPRAR